VIFGADSGDLDTGLDVRYVGRLRHDTELASLYSSADVMVVPSLQESFGKTAAEAMACGTPVTAFANSGLLDIVDHKQSGYLATLNSSADLADGIAWCVDGVSRDGGLRARARQKAVQAFNVPSVVGRYIDLYERILERRRRAADVDAGDEARRHVAA
jgi:glycosyltransferase involved in cell wall biosynthesis